MIESSYKPIQIPMPMRAEIRPKTNNRAPFKLQRVQNASFPEYHKSGSWKKQEVLKYTMFVQAFPKILENRKECREKHIFEHMAALIGTRNLNQCRSHHQKIVRQYGSTTQYLNQFKHQTQRLNFRFQSFQKDLQQLKQKVIGYSQYTETKMEQPSNLGKNGFGYSVFDKEQNKRTAESYDEPIKQERPRSSSIKLKEKLNAFIQNKQCENQEFQPSSFFLNHFKPHVYQLPEKYPIWPNNFAIPPFGAWSMDKQQEKCEGVEQFKKWMSKFDQNC